eukprot:Em0106g11a
MESKQKAYLRACSLASSEVPLRTRSRYSTGLKTKHLRLHEHDLLAQYGFENSAAACRPSEGYEDIQSETNDVDFTDKSFYNYCTSSRDSVDESLDCDETQRSKDCLAKEALRLNDTNMSSSMNEEETMSDSSPALNEVETDLQHVVCLHNCSAPCEEFITCDIEFQLKAIMADESTWTALQSRFDSSGNLSNSGIFGGTEYKKRTVPGEFLSSCRNISFCLNTDGVSLFKSSKVELWPIWLEINELPPKMRASKRYTILAGLWYSKQKPTMSTYMKPLVDKLNKLYKDGVEVNTPTGKIQVHCMVLMCSADLPAKAKVGNCVQYNGYNGCM